MTKPRFLISAAVATLGVLALVAWLRAGDSDGADGLGPTARAERRTFASTVRAIGAVKPHIGAEVRVGSRISGRVRRLRANIGDRIAKGQVIAELETEDLDALVAQRRAEATLAEAKLAAVGTLAPDAVARAEAEVSRFEATEKLTGAEAERQRALLEQGVTSRAEADAASERHAVARAQLEEARRTLGLVRMGNTEQRRQAEAEHARARATLQSALVDRSFATIVAPISGVVASVATQEGETVAAGLSAPTFVTIVDLARLQVNAFVDEVDIGQVAVGQQATFTVDAFPAREFTGRVAAIYPTATLQDNVVKYVVAIEITGDYAGLLRPEMTASVGVQLNKREVLAIPARAVRRSGAVSIVHVVTRDGARELSVRLGWRDGVLVEVVEGLAEGDRVLLEPPSSGREGPP